MVLTIEALTFSLLKNANNVSVKIKAIATVCYAIILVIVVSSFVAFYMITIYEYYKNNSPLNLPNSLYNFY